MHWARNGRGLRGSQGEPLICDFLGITTEGYTIPETVCQKYIFVKNVCLVK